MGVLKPDLPLEVTKEAVKLLLAIKLYESSHRLD